MQLKAGQRLRSAVCATEVVVVRAPNAAVDLRCGGRPMLSGDEHPDPDGAPASGLDAGTLLGKRYADDEAGIQVLCTKAGEGSLSLAETPLPLMEAKPLPASD